MDTTMVITAKFRGADKSCGLNHGQSYSLTLSHGVYGENSRRGVYAHPERHDVTNEVPIYASSRAFISNWIVSLDGNLFRDIEVMNYIDEYIDAKQLDPVGA